MIPTPTAHLIPVKPLESPYKDLPMEEKVRSHAYIRELDLMELRSFFPRKGVLDSITSHLLRGFLLHLNSLGIQKNAKDYHHNERIITTLLEQYVPGTNDTRIKFTLDETGTPQPELLTPRVLQ